MGQPIDLDAEGGAARLNERLVVLIHEEGELYAADVRCAIKEQDDTSCHACPIYTDDALDPRSALCAVGREQERICTALAAARTGPATG